MKPNSEVKTDLWRRGQWAKLSLCLDPNIGLEQDEIYVVEKVVMCQLRRYGRSWVLSLKLRDFDDGTNAVWFRASCFDNVTPI